MMKNQPLTMQPSGPGFDEDENQFRHKLAMKKSESKSGLSLLTRATSFMTWDTTDTSSRRKVSFCNDDEEAQIFPALLKRHSLHSLSGITILPTIYGSTNKSGSPNDDDISECSYMTGVQEGDNDSCLSFDSENQSASDENCTMKNVFLVSLSSSKSSTSISTSSSNHDIDATMQEQCDENKHFFKVLSQNIIASSVMVKTKSRGIKSHQSAPSFPISECIWTFTGSFTIIFLLCFLSSNIKLWNDHGYAFPLGPFGALTTLQYSLGDAAPAQPRNVILGSTLSGCIAMSSTYLPVTIISPAFRIALATSTSIALMAAFGIMHPPGGAIALVFAMGNHHWGHLLLTLVGCWVAVFLAAIINNLNHHRQYPQYWDFLSPFEKS